MLWLVCTCFVEVLCCCVLVRCIGVVVLICRVDVVFVVLLCRCVVVVWVLCCCCCFVADVMLSCVLMLL